MAVKNISAGELKRTVVFKSPVSTRNSQGGKETTFTEAGSAKAKIEATNQRMIEVAPVLLNTDTVHVRYSLERAAITKDWLVAYDGLDHVIHSVERTGAERNDFIRLIVKAKGG